MKVSVSARKSGSFPMRDHLDFMMSHARRHGNLDFSHQDIDYVYGFVETYCSLYGGRAVTNFGISKFDEYFLYDKGIGLKLPLSVRMFQDQHYQESLPLLHHYHHESNAITVSSLKLAERIRNDFPKYKIEASAVMDLLTEERFAKFRNDALFDTYVLPIAANDDVEWLKRIDIKDRIRLFWNAECSYTCQNKVCYPSQAGNNQPTDQSQIKCSHYSLNLPSTFYDDSVNWSEFYFDVEKFQQMGFGLFKMVVPVESQQHTILMYKNKPTDRVLY